MCHWGGELRGRSLGMAPGALPSADEVLGREVEPFVGPPSRSLQAFIGGHGVSTFSEIEAAVCGWRAVHKAQARKHTRPLQAIFFCSFSQAESLPLEITLPETQNGNPGYHITRGIRPED